MKTILKIIAILLAASVVAGGFVLTINKTLNASNSVTGNQAPAVTSANSQFAGQPLGRPEGEASASRGLSGIFLMLVELTGITAIVLLIENLFGMLKNRKLHPSKR